MRIWSHCPVFLLVISATLCACARPGGEQDNLNAVLWVQTSAEYTASTTGIYAVATTALQRTVENRVGDAERMAVVMDLDETILNNSHFKAHELLVRSRNKRKSWDEWVTLRNATAVPGAVEFIRASQELGVTVMIITNRRCQVRPDAHEQCPQRADTLANLQQIGVEVNRHSLMFRGERPSGQCLSTLSDAEKETGSWSTANKTSRRDCVGHDFDIVMMLGDQLGDFVGDSGGSTLAFRDALQSQHQDKWGKTWFMIPNPTYGTWFRLLYPDRRSHLRSE